MKSPHRRFGIFTLIFALPLLFGVARAAQNPDNGYGGPRGEGGPRRMMSPDERLKRMTKEFNLSADQQAKIKPILEDEMKKMQDLMNDSSGDRSSMRDKMTQIRKDTNDQIRAQLDDKQKEKFDKMEQQREQGMQNRRGPAMGAPGGENPGGNAPPQN